MRNPKFPPLPGSTEYMNLLQAGADCRKRLGTALDTVRDYGRTARIHGNAILQDVRVGAVLSPALCQEYRDWASKAQGARMDARIARASLHRMARSVGMSVIYAQH